MAEARDLLSTYGHRNIYNMDRSGIFYRKDPRCTYLTASECRAFTRRTEMQNLKQRVSIVICANVNGSHMFFVQCIGKSENSMCLRLAEFTPLRT